MQIRLLQTIASFAVPDLILRRADWYHSTVAPCCRALCRRDSARVSRNLACDVLLLQGDLLFVLGAYRAALQAYRDACNFSPENPDAVQGADDAQHALRAFRSTLRFKVHEALVERNLPRLATLLSNHWRSTTAFRC
jgi:hypothetical protein